VQVVRRLRLESLSVLFNYSGKPGGIPNNYASGPVPQGGAMNSFVPQQQQPASELLLLLSLKN